MRQHSGLAYLLLAIFVSSTVIITTSLVVRGEEKPRFDLPEEIRNLSKSLRPEPPRTVLDFDSTSNIIADTAVAVVWLKFKSHGNGGYYDIEVVFCSHTGFGLEERAIEALKAASFEPKSISGKKADKWLYYEVVFDRNFYRDNSTPFKDWTPEADSGEYVPAPDEFVPVEVMPEMIFNACPEYPRAARNAGVTGTVWVKCLVDKRGKVRQAMVGKSSGYTELDKSAVESSYKSRFSPALQNGQPIACWVTYRINFDLEYGN